MNAISKQLSEKISFLSLVAACLVVFIHVPHDFDAGGFGSLVQYVIVEGVARIAVPFFFAVSGFFLAGHIEDAHWYGSEVAKRVKTILVPYLLWCLIYVMPGYAMAFSANVLHGTALTRNFPAFSFVSCFGLSPIVDPQSAQLWYLRFLFTLVLLSPLLVALLREGYRWSMIVLSLFFIGNCILPGAIPRCDLHTFFRHAFVFNGFFYFFLGMMISRFEQIRKIRLSLPQSLVIGMIGFGLYLLNYHLYRVNAALLLMSVISAVSTLLVLASVWFSAGAVALPEWLKGLSFPLYLIHYIVIDLTVNVLDALHIGYSSGALGWYFITATVVIIVSVSCGKLLRRFFPLMTRYLLGGR